MKVSTRIDHFHGRKNNANPEFFFAFSIGPSQTIECLLKHGADPAKTDLCGRTAAHWAAIGGQVEAVRVLFSNHANKVNDPDDSDSQAPERVLTYDDEYEEMLELGEKELLCFLVSLGSRGFSADLVKFFPSPRPFFLLLLLQRKQYFHVTLGGW